MKLACWLVAGLMAGLSGSYAAFAEDEASFTVHMPLLEYKSMSSTAKPDGGTSATQATTQMATQDLSNSYVEASWGKMNLYVYPFSPSMTMVSPSYGLSPSLELGLDIGLNSSNVDKPKATTANNTYGAWGIYYLEISKALTLENTVTFDMNSNTSTKVDPKGGDDIKTDTADQMIKLSIMAVHPIAKNINYVGGIWYQMDTATTSQPTDAKGKATIGTLGLNLATVRFILK